MAKKLNTRNDDQTVQLSERLKANDQRPRNRDFNDSKSTGVPEDSSNTDAITGNNAPTPTYYHNDELSPTVPYNFTALLVQKLRRICHGAHNNIKKKVARQDS